MFTLCIVTKTDNKKVVEAFVSPKHIYKNVENVFFSKL